MSADIAKRHRPQYSIGQRVASHIRIRMSIQARFMRDSHASEDQRAARHQPMDIITKTDSDAIHGRTGYHSAAGMARGKGGRKKTKKVMRKILQSLVGKCIIRDCRTMARPVLWGLATLRIWGVWWQKRDGWDNPPARRTKKIDADGRREGEVCPLFAVPDTSRARPGDIELCRGN